MDALIDYMNEEILIFKRNFLESLTLIPQHKEFNKLIDDTLKENNSHDADNNIIQDIYGYYVEHKVIFVFFTFDKNFTVALNKCNFEFIESIINPLMD